MSIFPKLIYTLGAIPIKIPPAVFAKFKKDDPKIYVQMQETSNSQINVVWGKKSLKDSHVPTSIFTTKLQ